MEKCAIIIGINDIEGMTYLASPCSYARKMNEWAISQGFETRLFVDETDSREKLSVRIEEIMDAGDELLNENPDQILVYFAGHGVELYPGNDLWLLPGYTRRPNQAIDMAQNRQLVLESGANHVIFISDSCRKARSNDQARSLVGGPIFPSLRRKNYDVVVDTLFSTWPNESSIDYRDDNNEYKSIYSECLLDCLHGNVTEVIRQIENPIEGTTFPAVICQDLSKYLKKTVPVVMQKVTGYLQYPNSTVTSTEPLHISKFDTEFEKNAILAAEISDEHRWQSAGADQTVNQKLQTLARWKAGKPFKLGINGTIELIDGINRKMVNEDSLPIDKTGFVIHGNAASKIYLSGPGWMRFESEGVKIAGFNFFELEVRRNTSPTLYVSNSKETRYYPIAILPNFISSIVFKNGELITVDYLPTHGFRRQEAILHRTEVAKRKADIITAAQNGIFQGTHELGTYVRRYKSLDPTLGIFAAYAYFQNGKYDEVLSVFDYMSTEQEPVLADVKLLTELSRTVPVKSKIRNEIIFPMLTQGWSYMNAFDNHIYERFAAFLMPGLWTSFNKDGMSLLNPLFYKMKIK